MCWRNGRCELRIVRKAHTRGIKCCPLALEVVEFRRDGRRSAFSSEAILNVGIRRGSIMSRRAIADQTVVVGLLDPFVHNRARPGTGHFGAKDSFLVLERAGTDSVAASFREKDRNGIVRGVLLKLVVPRLKITRGTTPFICIQSEKVQTIRGFLATRQVVLKHRA